MELPADLQEKRVAFNAWLALASTATRPVHDIQKLDASSTAAYATATPSMLVGGVRAGLTSLRPKGDIDLMVATTEDPRRVQFILWVRGRADAFLAGEATLTVGDHRVSFAVSCMNLGDAFDETLTFNRTAGLEVDLKMALSYFVAMVGISPARKLDVGTNVPFVFEPCFASPIATMKLYVRTDMLNPESRTVSSKLLRYIYGEVDVLSQCTAFADYFAFTLPAHNCIIAVCVSLKSMQLVESDVDQAYTVSFHVIEENAADSGSFTSSLKRSFAKQPPAGRIGIKTMLKALQNGSKGHVRTPPAKSQDEEKKQASPVPKAVAVPVVRAASPPKEVKQPSPPSPILGGSPPPPPPPQPDAVKTAVPTSPLPSADNVPAPEPLAHTAASSPVPKPQDVPAPLPVNPYYAFPLVGFMTVTREKESSKIAIFRHPYCEGVYLVDERKAWDAVKKDGAVTSIDCKSSDPHRCYGVATDGGRFSINDDKSRLDAGIDGHARVFVSSELVDGFGRMHRLNPDNDTWAKGLVALASGMRSWIEWMQKYDPSALIVT
jgi:hypothetical protein